MCTNTLNLSSKAFGTEKDVDLINFSKCHLTPHHFTSRKVHLCHDLAIESPWLALGGPFLSSFACINAPLVL